MMIRVGFVISAALATAAHAQSPVPGPDLVPAVTAVKLFAAACLADPQGFSRAVPVAEANGMAQAPETGTWFHPRLNLSIQADDACSMVFASADPADRLLDRFAAVAAEVPGARGEPGFDPARSVAYVRGDGWIFEVQAMGEEAGDAYFRAIMAGGP